MSTQQRTHVDIEIPERKSNDPEILDAWPKSMRNGPTQCCFWATIAIGLLLTVILIPLSFSYVEYHEIALKKDTITNEVDTGSVYTNGQYFWGVNKKPLSFPRQYQIVKQDFSIFPSGGFEFDVSVVFWYRLNPEKLGSLYNSFGNAFHSQVVNRANAQIKNRAPDFTLEEYITRREEITRALYDALVDDLDEIFIELPADKFYLAEVQIPSEVRSRDLTAAVQEQRNLEERNNQFQK